RRSCLNVERPHGTICYRPFATVMSSLLSAYLAVFLGAGAPQQTLPDAVVYGQTAAVQALITSGADVNAPDEGGLTPLALAAMQGQTAIARLLIAAKAKVNDASSDGTTALMRAASANRGE